MTQAAVSWQVKALERRLDQPLFRRLPREVALTPAGERLAEEPVGGHSSAGEASPEHTEEEIVGTWAGQGSRRSLSAAG